MRIPALARGGAIVGGTWVIGGGSASTRWLGIWCATLCWAGLESAPVLAGELAYGGGYSLAYDNNITRVPTDPIAEFTQTLFGGFGYEERTADLNMRLVTQVERRNYLRNTYVEEKAYYVNGSALWTISPQKLTWILDDYASQIPISYATVDTPTNRTNANGLNTGPDLTLRLNPVDAAIVGARYGRLDIQGPGDNERYSAYVRGLHQISPNTNVSLNYLTTRVNFQDSETFSNYSLDAWFLRYQLLPSPSGMTVEAGTARIQQERLETPPPGRYGRFVLFYPITREATLSASLERQYSDAAIELLGGVTSAAQQPPAASKVSITAVSGPFYGKRGDLGFDYGGARFQVIARGFVRSVDYLQSDQSYEERNTHLECNWFSGPARIRAYLDSVKRTFLDFFQEDRNRAAGVVFGYRVNRFMGLSVEGSRLDGSSTATQNNFVDRRVSFALSFSTGSLYPAATRR